MYDVQVEDKIFNMIFQRRKGHRGEKLTTCIISEVVNLDKHGPERYKRVIERTVTLNVHDNDVKAIGFKWALTKALTTDIAWNKWSKTDRRAFWDKFMEVWGKKIK